jgi:micrococcal nuclease
MNKEKIILISAIILLFVINYSFLNNLVVNFLEEQDYVEVGRVIDGDTVVVGNESVRLLGINSPEQGEEYYDKAKEFLEGLILNKSVKLEYGTPKYDRYQRILAFVFISNTNINIELVRSGLANVYVLENKKYENRLRSAWEECVEKNVNLCEKSDEVCSECIEIEKFEEQIVVFKNICEYDCSLTGWEIKDEGRKKFVFGNFTLNAGGEVAIEVGEGINTDEILFWRGKDYVWTNTGDTLFLRDGEGKLILWREY